MNGCTQCDTVTVTFAIGINEASSSDIISIFPNPTHGKFTITIYNVQFKMYEIEIYNMLGEKVAPSNSFSGVYPDLFGRKSGDGLLDLSSQPDGIYLIHIKTEHGTATEKLIIRK